MAYEEFDRRLLLDRQRQDGMQRHIGIKWRMHHGWAEKTTWVCEVAYIHEWPWRQSRPQPARVLATYMRTSGSGCCWLDYHGGQVSNINMLLRAQVHDPYSVNSNDTLPQCEELQLDDMTRPRSQRAHPSITAESNNINGVDYRALLHSMQDVLVQHRIGNFLLPLASRRGRWRSNRSRVITPPLRNRDQG